MGKNNYMNTKHADFMKMSRLDCKGLHEDLNPTDPWYTRTYKLSFSHDAPSTVYSFWAFAAAKHRCRWHDHRSSSLSLESGYHLVSSAKGPLNSPELSRLLAVFSSNAACFIVSLTRPGLATSSPIASLEPTRCFHRAGAISPSSTESRTSCNSPGLEHHVGYWRSWHPGLSSPGTKSYVVFCPTTCALSLTNPNGRLALLKKSTMPPWEPHDNGSPAKSSATVLQTTFF